MDFGTISLELVPWIMSALRLVHFVGIILGVGAVTLLDLIIFKFVLMRRIEETSIRIVVFSSKVITIGLILLWLSGFGFLIYYEFYDLAKIDNPKLFAKIIIVAVLTLNSIMVHSLVIPQIKLNLGRHLLDDLTRSQCLLLIFIGTVSAISWYVSLILGVVPQFNKTVPAEIILASYVLLIVSVNAIIAIALVIMKHGKIVLPVGLTAERGTCGSCVFFSRYLKSGFYQNMGFCTIRMPPSKELYTPKAGSSDWGPNRVRDVDGCDLYRHTGKTYTTLNVKHVES